MLMGIIPPKKAQTHLFSHQQRIQMRFQRHQLHPTLHLPVQTLIMEHLRLGAAGWLQSGVWRLALII